MTDILLLNAPLATPHAPKMGVPSLVAYLRSRDLSVEAVDLNQEFFCRLLTASRILDGLQCVERRFLELNAADELAFQEMMVYCRLLSILNAVQRREPVFDLLRTGLCSFQDIQELDRETQDLLVEVASSACWPECIIRVGADLCYESPFNCFSIAGILQASDSPMMFSPVLEEVLPEVLARTSPRVVGISAVFSTQILPAFHCARAIKRLSPGAHVTIGGAAISVYLRDFQDSRLFELVDSLVLDEGERPLESLHGQLASSAPELSNIPGIRYLQQGAVVTTPSAAPIDLDRLPPPAYDVFPLDRYVSTREGLRLPIRFSRGCHWQKCVFCRTELPMVRHCQQRTGNQAYEHLREVSRATGARRFDFADECCDPEVMEVIATRLLADDLRLEWTAASRVSRSLTVERCKLYCRSGCQRLALGVESFSDRILRSMKKGITVELADETIRRVGPHVPLMLFMMVGFPTETRTEALEGYERVRSYLAEGLIQGADYTLFTLERGCEVSKHPLDFGVSNIRGSGNSDLNPDTWSFDCNAGMTRGEAFELFDSFNAYTPFGKTRSRSVVTVARTPVALRYDLSKLRQALVAEWGRLPFNTFGETLDTIGSRAVRVKAE